ncbi:MAG TPA: hypothetical protein VKX16_20090, partial [Chloroflexota bacterium]|nr:hypothetical protein [Chloroflexota bacterium]
MNAGTLALYGALRAASVFVRRVPVRVSYALASVVGLLAYCLFPLPRRAIDANLRVALPEAGRRRRAALARSAFRTDALNWVDTLRIPSLADEDIARMASVRDWDLVDRSLSHNRGLIMLTMHLGNFDLVGQLLSATGHRVTVPVERMRPERLFRFLVAQRASKGISIVPMDGAARLLLAALRRGEIVGLAADRNIQGRSVQVELFGRATELPAGPAALARHTGAPVLLGIGLRADDYRYVGIVRGPIPMERTGDAAR